MTPFHTRPLPFLFCDTHKHFPMHSFNINNSKKTPCSCQAERRVGLRLAVRASVQVQILLVLSIMTIYMMNQSKRRRTCRVEQWPSFAPAWNMQENYISSLTKKKRKKYKALKSVRTAKIMIVVKQVFTHMPNK